ncbi:MULTISPECIES: hypothetical protein [unclassified Variovorax]|uniref:hypothetical protein n=1 Tax=unclassified Variovorax TaxID=663243 RepID=UPI003F4496BC
MKNKSLNGCVQPLWIVASVCAAGLAGCGGGGGGSGGMPMLPVLPAAAPAPASSPPPAPAPAPNRDPVPGSEPLPSLSAPQAGSTAAVGNDSEGVYVTLLGLTYVGADGAIARQFNVGSLWGSIRVSGLNWTFNPDTTFYFVKASAVTGSGTFSPKVSMDGTYAYESRGSSAFGPLRYAVENALSVSQDSVVGKWANADTSFGIGVSIEVNAKGAFTGTTTGAQVGNCSISGTVSQAQPGTSKNMYGLTMKAVNTGTDTKTACQLNTTLPYAGPAVISLAPAGNFESNGYFRGISFLVKGGAGATLSANLRKL